MSSLKLYNVRVNEFDTVLQLSAEDAKARGLGSADLYEVPAPVPAADPDAEAAAAAEKAAAEKAASEKAAAEAAEKEAAEKAAAEKAATPANKSRTAANK